MSDCFTLQSSVTAVLQPAETHINCALTTVVLMYENILASALSEYGTVCRLALSVLSRYLRSVNP